jgi:hypothetical protein
MDYNSHDAHHYKTESIIYKKLMRVKIIKKYKKTQNKKTYNYNKK